MSGWMIDMSECIFCDNKYVPNLVAENERLKKALMQLQYKDLSAEKPPADGEYLVRHNNKITIDLWESEFQEFEFHAHTATHWAHIPK